MTMQDQSIPSVNQVEEAVGIIQRVAQAITNAAGVTEQLASLRNELDSLKRDADYLRNHNAELDGLVSQVRRERDEAKAELESIRYSQRDTDRLQRELDQSIGELVTVRKERDDAQFRVMELEADLKVHADFKDMIRKAVCPDPVVVHSHSGPDHTPQY